MIINKTILITRPEPWAGELATAIRQAGGKPLIFSAFEIAPPANAVDSLNVMADLLNYDWAIFVSPMAVMKAFEYLQGTWPKSLKVAAIGQGTADKLRSFGLEGSLIPEEFNSESLLDMPEFARVEGVKIILFRGEGGRTLLADTLQVRGAEVSHAVVYRRVAPVSGQFLWMEWKRVGIDAIVVTSQEALLNLVALTNKKSFNWLQRQHLIVTSHKIQAQALEVGFNQTSVASNASNQAIMDVLLSL